MFTKRMLKLILIILSIFLAGSTSTGSGEEPPRQGEEWTPEPDLRRYLPPGYPRFYFIRAGSWHYRQRWLEADRFRSQGQPCDKLAQELRAGPAPFSGKN